MILMNFRIMLSIPVGYGKMWTDPDDSNQRYTSLYQGRYQSFPKKWFDCRHFIRYVIWLFDEDIPTQKRIPNALKEIYFEWK